MILEGPERLSDTIGLSDTRVVVFDELHKYPNWKNFLKGFFDIYAESRFDVLVTGSARLDVYRRGADSLMGRYFLYRMHPVTVAEIARPRGPGELLGDPAPVDDADFESLLRFGGFPEPFLRRDIRFYNRWRRNRLKLLFREDLRETARILEVGQVELLAELLRRGIGSQLNYASLARKVRASQDSIRRWVSVLESLYLCFLVRPWSPNVPRSLLKDPKVYFWDWSVADDPGTRFENMVASHLLKAVHWSQDTGLGEMGLHYLRTKDGREVDFLVSRDGAPWILVEAKLGKNRPLGRNLSWFQQHTGAPHAFQLVGDADHVQADAFREKGPIKVPARSFLSQLV